MDPFSKGPYKYEKYLFAYEPFYIGKGYGKRSYDHVKNAHSKYDENRNSAFYVNLRNILDNKSIPVILLYAEGLSESSAFKIERRLIKAIGRKDKGKGPLLNRTDGGDGAYGLILSEEARNKIRNKLKGRKLPESTIKKIILSLIGRVVSKKTREKISKSEKGKVVGEHTRNFLSSLNIGKKLSDETREKIRKASIGRKLSDAAKNKVRQSRLGCHLSEQTKKKLSDAIKNKYATDTAYRRRVLEGAKNRRPVSMSTILKKRNSMLNRDPVLENQRRQKIGDKLRGRSLSEEHKLQISKTLKGRVISVDTRKKISKSLIERNKATKNTE